MTQVANVYTAKNSNIKNYFLNNIKIVNYKYIIFDYISIALPILNHFYTFYKNRKKYCEFTFDYYKHLLFFNH